MNSTKTWDGVTISSVYSKVRDQQGRIFYPNGSIKHPQRSGWVVYTLTMQEQDGTVPTEQTDGATINNPRERFCVIAQVATCAFGANSVIDPGKIFTAIEIEPHQEFAADMQHKCAGAVLMSAVLAAMM